MADEQAFRAVTSAQVERHYTVLAQDEEQAHKRLRTHLADPELLREGVVVVDEKILDKTAQRVVKVEKVAVPKPAREPKTPEPEAKA